MRNMTNALDWTTVDERLRQILPHNLDEETWRALQRYPLSFVADELLWRVEAIAL